MSTPAQDITEDGRQDPAEIHGGSATPTTGPDARIETIRTGMMTDLEAVRRTHEIGWRALLASQRRLGDRTAVGTAPPLSTFLANEVEPTTTAYLEAARRVVDTHLMLAWDVIVTAPPSPGRRKDDRRGAIAAALAPLRACRLDRANIETIGELWQQRLRRQAIRRYVRNGPVHPDGFAAGIDATELDMLRRPPWRHVDHHLAHIERVHADLGRLVTERVDALVDDLVVDLA